MYEELEKIFGYKFKNKELLRKALTHPSMSFNQKHRFNNERLEFLGDSILSAVIAEYLTLKYKDDTEGDLSKKKHFLVSKEVLSSIGRDVNLGKYLIMSNGEELTHGRENINNLENAMEAVLGAIFLDSSFDNTKSIILNVWKDYLDKDIEKDPKMALQEWTQKNLKVLPKYEVIKTEIVDKIEEFTIKLTIDNIDKNFVLIGHNIKYIEKQLAKDMLDYLKENYKIRRQ